MTDTPLPRAPGVLGLAGLLPQVACVVVAVAVAGLRGAAVMTGALYAGVILSFLGGMWWMDALARGETRPSPYVVAVVPSLVAWAALSAGLLALIPTALALGIVAVALIASPLADRAVSTTYRASPGWRRLRAILSTGLGALTLVLAAL